MRPLSLAGIIYLCALSLASNGPASGDPPSNNVAPDHHTRIVILHRTRSVTIDGDLKDWPDAALMVVAPDPAAPKDQAAKLGVMWDDQALYIGAEVRDPTPMVNAHRPATDPNQGWAGDSCQIRMGVDPSAGYVFEKPAQYHDIIHLCLWYDTADRIPCLRLSNAPSLDGDLPGHAPGAEPKGNYQAAYQMSGDGKGYTFEYRIPWKTLNTRVPLRDGDTVPFTTEFVWGTPDGKAQQSAHATFSDILLQGVPFYQPIYNAPQLWGAATLVSASDPTRARMPAIRGAAIVHCADTRQTITGFGASGGNRSADNFRKLSTHDRDALYNLLFSRDQGIGLTMVRNEIFWHIEETSGAWDWSKDDDQIALMNAAKARGATLFWSAAWSMPAWMKDNKSITHGGHLLPEYYQDYADYLSRYVREYKSRFGIDLYAVSIQNEPNVVADYESCAWSGPQFHDFIKNYLGPTFRRDGVTAKIIMPEFGTWDFSDADATMTDPESRQYVDVLAGHGYWKGIGNLADYAPARQYHKQVWQTEVSTIGVKNDGMQSGLEYARMIHEGLTQLDLNSWSYWVFLNSWGDSEGLATMTGNTDTASKRLYCLGNWSKFVRPGYVRVAMETMPAPWVFTSAYKDPAGGPVVIVALNQGSDPATMEFQIADAPLRSVQPWVTSETEDLASHHAFNVRGNHFRATVGAKSVVTYVCRP